jgi:DNA-binding NarL/FixJ family response regulator
MISVVLVDDHPVTREGLRSLFEVFPDFKILGETGNGFEAVELIKNYQPTVALLDIMIEGINGIEVAKQIDANKYHTAIIIFSMLSSERYVTEALRAGVKGYLSKESPVEELVYAMREVASGKRYLCSPVKDQSYVYQTYNNMVTNNLKRLTPREHEVLQSSLEGSTCSDIARKLGISRRTVEAHRANMMRKLGISSATGLYRYVFQNENLSNKDYIYKLSR